MHDKRSLNSICPNCFATLNKFGFCPVCRKWAKSIEYSPIALSPKTLLQKKYLLGRTLGIGGFGITYAAWEPSTCSKLAIKEFFPRGYVTRIPGSAKVGVLKPDYLAAFKHWLSAFIDEASVLTSISHLPGVVGIRDFFVSNDTAYIVMEYLEGVSLQQYLVTRGGRLTLEETLRIMRPVLESLLKLHQYGVIHKDISPANIQIVRNREVKLIDFGAASLYNNNVAKPYLVLKHGYSPIESYRADLKQGPQLDIYEAGATIYSCITGIIPPPAPNRVGIDGIIKPSAYRIQIPVVRENALLKALKVNAAERYDNMGEFIQMMYGEFMPPPLIKPEIKPEG